MAELTNDEVRALARLARLRIPDASLPALRRELTRILEHFAALQAVDVDGVPPTAHVLELTGATRRDEPRAGLSGETAVAGAPDAAEGLFRVPRVLT